MRTAAKIINFGILYGMAAPALAEKIGSSKKQAEKMIAAFFETYTGFASWAKATREFLQEHHYVEGMFGHRRHLPNVVALDRGVREEAFRAGQNFPIQNTASCLTAYCQMFLDNVLTEDGFLSNTFGQVHDSIWTTGPMEESEAVLPLIPLVMESSGFPFLEGKDPRWPRPVPIAADVKWGYNLRDLKKFVPGKGL